MKLNSDYWENRYKTNEISWDAGTITTPLKEYIDQIEDKSIKILIPGAGNSYEFEYLINNGFQNVYVLDFAQSPLDNIKERVSNCNENQLIKSDFFEHDTTYDLILEQTFFCAIDPSLRENYVAKMKSLLNSNGTIAGLLFQFPLTDVGPPFGGSKSEYLALFQNDFEVKTLETAYNSIKPRQGNELFFIFTKKKTMSHNIILNKQEIDHKIKRIAYQIFETFVDEESIIVAGIASNGYVFAEKLAAVLQSISPLEVILCEVTLDKQNLNSEIKTSLPKEAYQNKGIILVDDVLNSGSTLMYGVKHFLDVPLKKFKTAVLVDRNHKKYPIKVDFKGISLSTSSLEHVTVVFEKDNSYATLS